MSFGFTLFENSNEVLSINLANGTEGNSEVQHYLETYCFTTDEGLYLLDADDLDVLKDVMESYEHWGEFFNNIDLNFESVYIVSLW